MDAVAVAQDGKRPPPHDTSGHGSLPACAGVAAAPRAGFLAAFRVAAPRERTGSLSGLLGRWRVWPSRRSSFGLVRSASRIPLGKSRRRTRIEPGKGMEGPRPFVFVCVAGSAVVCDSRLRHPGHPRRTFPPRTPGPQHIDVLPNPARFRRFPSTRGLQPRVASEKRFVVRMRDP